MRLSGFSGHGGVVWAGVPGELDFSNSLNCIKGVVCCRNMELELGSNNCNWKPNVFFRENWGYLKMVMIPVFLVLCQEGPW